MKAVPFTETFLLSTVRSAKSARVHLSFSDQQQAQQCHPNQQQCHPTQRVLAISKKCHPWHFSPDLTVGQREKKPPVNTVWIAVVWKNFMFQFCPCLRMEASR
eukprot:g31860.t1